MQKTQNAYLDLAVGCWRAQATLNTFCHLSACQVKELGSFILCESLPFFSTRSRERRRKYFLSPCPRRTALNVNYRASGKIGQAQSLTLSVCLVFHPFYGNWQFSNNFSNSAYRLSWLGCPIRADIPSVKSSRYSGQNLKRIRLLKIRLAKLFLQPYWLGGFQALDLPNKNWWGFAFALHSSIYYSCQQYKVSFVRKF